MNSQLAAEIQAEQDWGREKWGTSACDYAHDDQHTEDDWHKLIEARNLRASWGTPLERRQQLVKLAGLAVSAIEAFDRQRERG